MNYFFAVLRYIVTSKKDVLFVSTKQLKDMDTIGKCQRPVFTLGVSPHMHKKQTCENMSSIGRQSYEIIMKEKTPLKHEVVCFQMLDFEVSISKSEV